MEKRSIGIYEISGFVLAFILTNLGAFGFKLFKGNLFIDFTLFFLGFLLIYFIGYTS